MIYSRSHLHISPTSPDQSDTRQPSQDCKVKMLKSSRMIICPKNISIQRIEIWPLVSLHPQGSHARQRKCLIFAMLMRMTRVNKMSGWMAGRMVGGRSWREGWLWKGGRVPAVGQTNINGVPTHLHSSALLYRKHINHLWLYQTKAKPLSWNVLKHPGSSRNTLKRLEIKTSGEPRTTMGTTQSKSWHVCTTKPECLDFNRFLWGSSPESCSNDWSTNSREVSRMD